MLLQNNQWLLELGDDLSGSPFELALAKAKAVVMVLDDGAVALTRIWCLVSALSPCLAIFNAVCAVTVRSAAGPCARAQVPHRDPQRRAHSNH